MEKYLELTCKCPVCDIIITIENEDLEALKMSLYNDQIYYIDSKAIGCIGCGYVADFIIIDPNDVDDRIQFERICLNNQCDLHEKSYFLDMKI